MCVLWLGACAASAQRKSRRSAYDSLSPAQLMASLSALGMSELETELMRQRAAVGTGQAELKEMAAKSRIKAARGAADPAQREALLDGAVKLLREAANGREQEAANAKAPLPAAQATIKRMQAQLLLARTQALTRGEPYAEKLLFLQGAEADRKALAKATDGAAKLVSDLGEEVEERKLEWRAEMSIWIVVMREVRGLEAETKYYAAKIRFFHGMAAKHTKTGRRDLRAVEPRAETFIEGSHGRFAKQQSELLIARALRELGRHDAADKMLARITGPGVSADLRMVVEFERVRNRIEYGRTLAKDGKSGNEKYGQIPAMLKAFRSTASKLVADVSLRRRAELRATLLGHYLYESRAASEKNKSKAAAYGVKAQEALLGFLDKYDDEAVQDAFYEIIYTKYRDRKDYDKLSSVVLMAIASHDFTLAENDKANTAALRTAMEVLGKIYKRSDKVSKRVRPLVLWKLAFIMNYKRDNFSSARLFAELATEFPAHKLAYKAAMYARSVIHDHYQQAERANQVADNLRRLYIKIFNVYCGGKNWRDRKEVLPWNFQLAEQQAYFVEKEEKIAVLEADAKAHNAALDVRQAELATGEIKDPTARQAAEARLKTLKVVAEAAGTKAQAARGAARTAYRRIALVYERVPDEPSNHMAYMQARQRALRYRKYILDLLPARTRTQRANKKTEALAMADRLLKYSAEVLAALPATKQKSAISDLKDWGSEAMLLAAEVLLAYGGPGQSERAMRVLLDMRTKWPGTAAVQYSEDLRIRTLAETGRTDKAIEALDDFIKAHPTEGDELLKMVITNLQDRIDRDEDSPRPEIRKRWRKYVENYVKLAGKLYSRVEKQPLDQRYAITQTYADSLLKSARFKEALALFLKCQAYDKKHADKQRGEITAEFKGVGAKVAAAATYERLKARRSDLKAALRRHGIDLRESLRIEGAVIEADLSLGVLAKADASKHKPEVIHAHMDQARTAIAQAFEHLEKLLKAGVKVQAVNVLGLARAYKGRADEYKKEGKAKEMQDDYEQALKYFRSILSSRLDMSVKAQARMRWLAELGYCDCILAAMGHNKSAVRDVLRRISISEHEDNIMGGFSERFLAIRRRARRLLSN